MTGAGRFPQATLIPCLALLSILLGLHLIPLQAGEFKLPVWAPDDVSGFNTALRRRDFSVSVDTQPAAVKAIIPPSGNLVLLVVADAVNRVEEFDTARRTLIESMEDFNKRELVAVLRAQDGLRVILDPSANREATAKALLEIPVSGIPGLLDSVEQVTAIANEMIAKSKVRVAILYITDGSIYEYRGDYTSPVINPSDSGDLSRRFRDRLIQERISRLTDSALASAAPQFFLHLSERNDALNVVYQNGLLQLGKATGGDALFARSLGDVPALVERLVQLIRNHYLITVEPSGSPSGLRRLQVTAPAARPALSKQQVRISGSSRGE